MSENLGLSVGKNKRQLMREPFPVMQDFGSVFFLFFPMVGEFHRPPMGNMPGLAISKHAVEHSGSAEQSDMSTVQRRERPASDVIQLGQKHTARLTIRGGFQQQVLHFVQWNTHVGQYRRLRGRNFVTDLSSVTQRLKLSLRCQRFEVSHSIQQDSIRNPGVSFAARCQHYDLLVLQASRLGEPEHSQIREMFA